MIVGFHAVNNVTQTSYYKSTIFILLTCEFRLLTFYRIELANYRYDGFCSDSDCTIASLSYVCTKYLCLSWP